MTESNLQVEGGIAVVEEEKAFLVVRAEDPGDWLVRFEKGPGFSAREWAENMVAVYNRRLSEGATPEEEAFLGERDSPF